MPEWRPVPGYEAYYISDDGQVYSTHKHGRLLKQKVSRFGYSCVVLQCHGKKCTVAVHRLVATAFIPNPNSLPQVNHINEVKTDNRAENLEWCSCSYNINYGHRNATVSKKLKSCKEATTARKIEQIDLNTGKVVHIWPSVREAARGVGVAHHSIYSVCTGSRKRIKGYGWRYAS